MKCKWLFIDSTFTGADPKNSTPSKSSRILVTASLMSLENVVPSSLGILFFVMRLSRSGLSFLIRFHRHKLTSDQFVNHCKRFFVTYVAFVALSPIIKSVGVRTSKSGSSASPLLPL